MYVHDLSHQTADCIMLRGVIHQYILLLNVDMDETKY